MSNLTIAWILFTPVFAIFFSGFIWASVKKEGEKLQNSFSNSLLVISILLWWGIYFLIN